MVNVDETKEVVCMDKKEKQKKREAEYEVAYKRRKDRIDAASPYKEGELYEWDEEKQEPVLVWENINADKEKYWEIRGVVSRYYRAVLAPEGGSLIWDEDTGEWVPDKYRSHQSEGTQPKVGTFSSEDLAMVQNHFHELILEIAEPFKKWMKGDEKLPLITNELFCKGLWCRAPACSHDFNCKLSERNGKPLLIVNHVCRFNDACDYYEITIESCVLTEVD